MPTIQIASQQHTMAGTIRKSLAMIGPGILVAATGVGAGDLLSATFAGSVVGMSVVWAAVAGSVLKWTLNEGLARWQMATRTTLLEGWVQRLPAPIQWIFLVYLLIWTVWVGGTLVRACGVAGSGLIPLGSYSVEIWGTIHALVALVVVWLGGFAVFETLMSIAIGIMFVTVTSTTLFSQPDWLELARGLLPPIFGQQLPEQFWPRTLSVLGGVGGTVTVLSYGYWIREENRDSTEGVRACRLDLTVGYGMTGIFGVCMIVIGSRVKLGGADANLAPELANQLSVAFGRFGPVAKWGFLIGFWAAVYSSMLGVWQGVPYLFADFLRVRKNVQQRPDSTQSLTKTRAYRIYLVAMVGVSVCMVLASLLIPNLQLDRIQLVYAVLGSLFMPLLAATLIYMNNRADWVGRQFKNGVIVNLILAGTLAFFGFAGFQQLQKISSSWLAPEVSQEDQSANQGRSNRR